MKREATISMTFVSLGDAAILLCAVFVRRGGGWGGGPEVRILAWSHNFCGD